MNSLRRCLMRLAVVSTVVTAGPFSSTQPSPNMRFFSSMRLCKILLHRLLPVTPRPSDTTCHQAGTRLPSSDPQSGHFQRQGAAEPGHDPVNVCGRRTSRQSFRRINSAQCRLAGDLLKRQIFGRAGLPCCASGSCSADPSAPSLLGQCRDFDRLAGAYLSRPRRHPRCNPRALR